jgi:excisionase family DNA binding protein
MVGMFCSLKEAAERLHVSEDEVEVMLEQGALREFREGPHRLVKADDVGTLARPLVCLANDSSGAFDDREMRLPHCAAVTLRAPAPSTARPRKTGGTRQRRMSTCGVRRNEPASSGSAYGRTSRPTRRTGVQTQDLSVRQWFWNGLTQDRPVTIAILFGLVLLILSALIAGVCVLGPLVVRG